MEEARKKKKRIPLGRIIILCLMLPAAYVGLQVYRATNVTYAYETAVTATMSDTMEVQGAVLFDETAVEGGGELGYLVADGERVSAGTRIAERYTDDAQAGARAQLNSLEAEISLLQKSQNTSSAQVDVLLNERNTAIYSLLEAIEHGQTDQIAAVREDYLLAQNKLQITTGVVGDFSNRIAALTEQKEPLLQQLAGLDVIAAPSTGYFVSSESARLLTLSRKEILALDAAGLQRFLSGSPEQEMSGLAGKLVSGYRWTFCGICTPQQAQKLQGRTTVQISFPGKMDAPLSARVVSVETDEQAGLARFVLNCQYINAEVLKLGAENALITLETYTGLRVSAQALHLVREDALLSSGSSSADADPGAADDASAGDYIQGVFVKYGNLARFRRAQVLYQSADEAYVLVAPDGAIGTDNEVRLYDEIIISGTDLYDGKLL